MRRVGRVFPNVAQVGIVAPFTTILQGTVGFDGRPGVVLVIWKIEYDITVLGANQAISSFLFTNADHVVFEDTPRLLPVAAGNGNFTSMAVYVNPARNVFTDVTIDPLGSTVTVPAQACRVETLSFGFESAEGPACMMA